MQLCMTFWERRSPFKVAKMLLKENPDFPDQVHSNLIRLRDIFQNFFLNPNQIWNVSDLILLF